MNLSLQRVTPVTQSLLSDLFATLDAAREASFFAPHPFTPEQAAWIAEYQGADYYAVGILNQTAVAYGFLRGWDEGYDTPSLGISIHPVYRGSGVGRAFMHYLHAVAALRNCRRVRLRVNRDNLRARRLYQNLGYRFQDDGQTYSVGFLELQQKPAA